MGETPINYGLDLLEVEWPISESLGFRNLPSKHMGDLNLQSSKGFIESLLRSSDQQGLALDPALEKGTTTNGSGSRSSHDSSRGSSQKRRRNTCLKLTKEPLNLVCGENISMAQLLGMAETTVVGRVRGKYPSLEGLENWVNMNWYKLLNYMLEIMVLF